MNLPDAFWMSLAPTIASLAVAYVTVRASSRSAKADKEADKKQDLVISQNHSIEKATNGHLSIVTGELRVANERIAGLESMLRQALESERIVAATAASANTERSS